MSQLIGGTLLAAFFLLLQVQATPYKQLSDDFLASSASFSLVVFFVCAYAFKDATLTTLPDIESRLSPEQRSIYVLDQLTLTAILMSSLIAALFVSLMLFTVIFARERKLALDAALNSKARRLRSVEDDSEVPAPPLTKQYHHHLFLSQ